MGGPAPRWPRSSDSSRPARLRPPSGGPSAAFSRLRATASPVLRIGYDETKVQPRVQDRGREAGGRAGRVGRLGLPGSATGRERPAPLDAEAAEAPISAVPGDGQQRAELAEIAALKKEVAKLRAERDILRKVAIRAPLVRATMATPSSCGKRHDLRFRREAPAHLAGQMDVRSVGRLSVRLPRLAQATD